MDILEVILLIVGIVIFIGSFYCGGDRTPGRIDTDAAKQEIHGLIEEEMKTVRCTGAG